MYCGIGSLPRRLSCCHTNSSSSSSSTGCSPAAVLHPRCSVQPCRRSKRFAGMPAHDWRNQHGPGAARWVLSRPPAAGAGAAPSATAPGGLRVLYPQLSPHDSGYLQVSDVHTLYYEIYGNPRGVPAIVVHGGPGAACWPNHARFFDPRHYRIILLDQRGCGRSTPYGCLQDNTTAHLVNDLEQLRSALGVSQWVMLGGSWGVTLTLAYAQAYPSCILGIILRGVCLMRPQEIHWMFGGGAGVLKPLAWARFLQHLQPAERSDPVAAYYSRLLSPDATVRTEAAKAWSAWEMAVGFSSGQNVVVWDGQQWGEQASPAVAAPQPQQQQTTPAAGQQALPPPPRPLLQAAVSAAAAATSGVVPLLRRDLSGSAWFSSLQQQQQQQHMNCTTNIAPSAPTVATTVQQQSNNASRDRLVRPHRRNGGSSAPSALPSSSQAITGAAAQGALPPAAAGVNGQQQAPHQAALLQLLQRGLQHRGFRSQEHAQALLEAHYSIHAAFLQQQPLLDHMDRLRHIPCIAVQGQWDLVCPPTTAVELGQAWPEMELRLVPRAGHSMYDPAILHELVTATDRMRVLQAAAGWPAQQQVASLAGAC